MISILKSGIRHINKILYYNFYTEFEKNKWKKTLFYVAEFKKGIYYD